MLRREPLRQFCLTLPGVSEEILWEKDLVFKVGGKMFAVQGLEGEQFVISFKCTPETFAELTEQPGIEPAPYLARAHWVSLTSECRLRQREVMSLVRISYDLVVAKLPKKSRL